MLSVFIFSMLVFFLFFRVAPVVIGAGNPLAPAKSAFDPVSAAAGSSIQGNPAAATWLGYTSSINITGPLRIPVEALVFLYRVVTMDFGYSRYSHRPVIQEILIRLPYTLVIYLVGVLVPILVGYYLAVKSLRSRGRLLDMVVMVSSIMSYVTPPYVLLLVIYYFLAYLPKVVYGVRIFPLPTRAPVVGPGTTVEELFYLAWYVTPIYIALVLTSFGQWAYYIRQLLVSEAERDYVVTSRAIGKDEETILRREMLPNVRGPLATSLAYTIPTVFGGSIVLEMLTSWPGVAYYAYNALQVGDFSAIVGFYTISVILVIVSLYITDIVIAVLDPRVRLGFGSNR